MTIIDGVYFSIQAIRLYHPEIVDDVEFLVVDNHPDGPCGEPFKKLEDWIPTPLPPSPAPTAGRRKGPRIREADGDSCSAWIAMSSSCRARLLT